MELQLTHHFPGREAEFVAFVEGLSQGCPSGSSLTMLALHLALHITLSKYPNLAIRILAIIDDLSLLGTIRDIVIIYIDLKTVLKSLFGLTLNVKKSSLLCLQFQHNCRSCDKSGTYTLPTSRTSNDSCYYSGDCNC